MLVCGGRDFNLPVLVASALAPLKPSLVIVGGATGADTLAFDWAWEQGIPVSVYRAAWKQFGRAAGPIRNQRMIDEGKPDVVVAFPGGRGTADMVRRAKAAGIPVKHYDGTVPLSVEVIA